MPTGLYVTGIGDARFANLLRAHFRSEDIRALGLGVAYVSIYGATQLQSLLARFRIDTVRMVVDIGDAITHPRALDLGLQCTWRIRVVNPPGGSFHPKLIVGGTGFGNDDLLTVPRLLIVGSANLTRGGLDTNVECSLARTSERDLDAAARAFRRLWQQGTELDQRVLAKYEAYFAEQNRGRAPRDMEILGVADGSATELANVAGLRSIRSPRPNERSMPTSVATAAWAGLQSFTGEYRFQVEFPRDAGQVLRRMLGPGGGQTNVMMLCEDGQQRLMRFRYYEDNAMFRLNVSNETPGVERARVTRSGLAIVEAGAIPAFRIVDSEPEMSTIIGRSVALGTWGRTTTRLYGWF